MIGELDRLGEESGSASLVELIAGRLESEPAMADYFSRLLLDGGRGGRPAVRGTPGHGRGGNAGASGGGDGRPARDERIRTAFLLCNDLSLVLLRRHIARAVSIDPLTREGPRSLVGSSA